jgi:hypothetical protein
MEILHNSVSKLLIKLEEEEIHEAVYDYIIAKFPEYESFDFEYKTPRIGAHLFKIEYKGYGHTA